MILNRSMKLTLILTCWSMICYESSIWAQDTSPKKIDEFRLTDFRGKEWSMREFEDKPIVVVAFLGTECPLANFYALRLQELSETFSERGVQFVAIDSNIQDSLEEMAAFAKRQSMDFPFLKDPDAKVADAFGATRTPEAYVLDRNRIVRYHGRIDDQYGIGYVQKNADASEVNDAINALLDDKPIAVTSQTAVGCLIGRKKHGSGEPTFTYASHVAEILNSHCIRCHREGQIGPFALDNYANAAAWSDMIAEVVRENRMPPWQANPKHGEFANDCSLTSDEKKILLSWAETGAAQGDATKVPPVPQFTNGWQLPKTPDFSCSVTPRPVKVKSTGDVPYKYFVHDPEFTEDKWVQAAELRPGNYGVVHHILCFILPKGAKELEQDLDGFLVGYVPGMLPPPLPKGHAKKIPAGSKFVFQVHYTPNGREQTDQSQLGIVFAADSEVTHEVLTTCAVNPKINIPPNDNDYSVTAWNRMPLQEWKILSLMPHMHLRGKSFRYVANYPDGKKEVLLDVPEFDFNWQTSYLLKEPKSIPANTKIQCIAVYDNSSKNLNNPDPEQTVRWGDQTWEEMMIGYFDIAIPRDEVANVEKPRRRQR